MSDTCRLLVFWGELPPVHGTVEVQFGMIALQTKSGPRLAHGNTPLLYRVLVL